MSSVVNVAIHSSQFPANVRRDLLDSLRKRQINHKFHYDSIKQTQKWLELHRQFSPSRHDADCAAIYDRSFESVSHRGPADRIHVIGLGCGGGQKDSRLLNRWQSRGAEVFYTPTDVSTAMVLVASQTASAMVSAEHCFPFVCDLASAGDLASCFERPGVGGCSRVITFFGMIPNFEPQAILPKLASLIRPGDSLLFSANLASDAVLADGLRAILPQYDNRPTREWLTAFLLDLGVEPGDGELRFKVEADETGLRRIVANYDFVRTRNIRVDSEQFEFQAGNSVRLFFSYRYTAALVESLLDRYGLQVHDRWIAASNQEGVFLCSRR
jgi:L-histidine Nalpha-methyltransferase